jgi:hypothetical protein
MNERPEQGQNSHRTRQNKFFLIKAGRLSF